MVLNQERILKKAIDKFVLKGNNDINYIDALIYGTVEDFVFVKKDEIKEIIINKKDLYATSIHFGPLFCQPMSRCLNYNKKIRKIKILCADKMV